MAFRIYTKTGDSGETGLFGGERVSKDHARVAAYGALDELNAVLGCARSASAPLAFDALLGDIQTLLFELGSDLATPPGAKKRPRGVIDADIAGLEAAIDEHEGHLEPLKSFILPGGSAAASHLHWARTVCRRAERSVVTLLRLEPETSESALRFLNRLSDLLFVLARRANALAGVGDVPWSAR